MTNIETFAALFDLDGVIFNTEPQYSIFWSKIGRQYHPEINSFEQIIKGQTLMQIYDRFFTGQQEVQAKITEQLNEFEHTMVYEYVPGVHNFLQELQYENVRTAVVTSSNSRKMKNIYHRFADFKLLFDKIFTGEMFKKSKPNPDCYLLGAETFHIPIANCVVFEDSFNGLRAGRSAKMKVVGLSTTNSYQAIKTHADIIIPNFENYSYEEMLKLIKQ